MKRTKVPPFVLPRSCLVLRPCHESDAWEVPLTGCHAVLKIAKGEFGWWVSWGWTQLFVRGSKHAAIEFLDDLVLTLRQDLAPPAEGVLVEKPRRSR